jgi:hypothetical protein
MGRGGWLWGTLASGSHLVRGLGTLLDAMDFGQRRW